jgi:hypothetical protein
MKSVRSHDSQGNTCHVHQLGVDLKVDDGRIVYRPDKSETTTINVTNAFVTFEGMTCGATTCVRGTPPSATPALPNASARTDDGGWEDMFWVPSIDDRNPSARLAMNWREKLSGRVVLTGGTLRGGMPSEGAAVNHWFDFKDSQGKKSSQAITDRTIYSTQVRGTQVVLHVDSQIYVIEPIDGRKTVGLILVGRHETDHPMQGGDKMTDFCAFYELLENPPPIADRLIPEFVKPSTPPGSQGGQPSPGLFCSGATAKQAPTGGR